MIPLSPFQESVRTYVKAGYPILYVVTAEEERAIDLISRATSDGAAGTRKAYVWSVSRGLAGPDGKVTDSKTADPARILPYLGDFKQPGIFILEDFHFFLDER